MQGPTYVVQERLVILVDVLGQSRLLRDVAAFPTTPEALRRTVDVLNDTAGFITTMRSQFLEYFTSFNQPSEVYSRLSRADQALYRRVRRCEARTSTFSDTVVISIPLEADNDNLTAMIGVFAALLACCLNHAWALAQRRPLRGGVDAGWIVPLAGDEVYGPALAEAYRLESRVACMPRILVGDRVHGILRSVIAQPNNGWAAEKARDVAEACLALFAEDDDHKQYLDVLGASVARLAIDEPRLGELMKPMFDRALDVARIEEVRLASDDKAKEKWSWIRLYLERRSQFWSG